MVHWNADQVPFRFLLGIVERFLRTPALTLSVGNDPIAVPGEDETSKTVDSVQFGD